VCSWSLTPREEHRLRAFEKEPLRTICGCKKKIIRYRIKLHNEELCNLYFLPVVVGMIQ
jgi:hypothetical protein